MHFDRLHPSRRPLDVPHRFWMTLAAVALVTAPSHAGDWLEFADETATRLVADAGVGTADTEEKDLIAGDVDRDGDIDMLIARKVPFSTAGGRANVLFMNEGGVMTDRTATLAADMLDATDDRDVLLVDVDGDQWLDVVTVTTFFEQPRVYMNLGNDVGGNWLGFDYDAMTQRLPTFSPGPKFCAVAAGDVDGQNGPDLYFVDYDSPLEDRLLINDGNGFFTDETASRMTLAMYESVFGTDAAIVDLDGDGDMDIVKNNSSGSTPPPGSSQPAVRALYNDGTGNFDFMDLIYTDAPYMVETADMNGDQRVDIFVVDDLQDSLLVNTGNDAMGHAQWSTQAVTSSPGTSDFGGNTKIVDMDLDGRLDVLVADVDTDIAGCDRNLTILRGQGTGQNVTLSDPLNGALRPWTTQGTFDIEVFDIDGDTVPDLWVATCTGNQIFINQTEAAIPVFNDGFESADTLAWSATVVD